MSNEPLISVIIPTYNRSATIARAINSVLQQTYSPIEILVIDDGSTDDSRSEIDRFNDVKYFYKPNGGQASARNFGLKKSSGTYIATLDSDDQWEPKFLEKCINKLEADNLDFVFANWMQQTEGQHYQDYLAHYPCLPENKPFLDSGWVNLEYPELRKLYIMGCPSPSSSLVLRADRLQNGWCTDMNIGDDWCMILDIILNRKTRAAYTTETLWRKHINGDNIVDGRDQIHVYRLLWVQDLGRILKRYKYFLNAEEMRTLQSRYIKSMFINALLHIKNKQGFHESWFFMKTAFGRWPLFTPFVFLRGAFNYLIKGKNLTLARKKLGL